MTKSKQHKEHTTLSKNMEIVLTKRKNRNTMTCIGQDGSITSVSIVPSVINHDLAHYIVENKLKLKSDFFGNIKSGKSIEELSDPELIQDLSPETWLSEILTRNLQSLRLGSVKKEQFKEIITLESEKISGIKVPEIEFENLCEMKQDFDVLCDKWNSLFEGEKMTLFL